MKLSILAIASLALAGPVLANRQVDLEEASLNNGAYGYPRETEEKENFHADISFHSYTSLPNVPDMPSHRDYHYPSDADLHVVPMEDDGYISQLSSKQTPLTMMRPFHFNPEERVRFDHHRLLKLRDVTPSMLETLQDLPEADIWHVSGSEVTVRVTPALFDQLKAAKDISFVVLKENLQDEIDQENARLASIPYTIFSELNPDKWFQEYHRFDDIKAWYQELAAKYSNLMEFIPNIGVTHQNRTLFAVKLGDKSVKKKDAIWFQSGQHAREWIAPAVTQFITYKLLTEFSEQSVLKKVEIILVPVMNPDGYEYTWKSNRYWRKNMRYNSALSNGVDLNRNWNDHWGQGGSSKSPISDTYMGPSAASEPEVKALEKLYLQNKHIIGAIDFHCYSQLLLLPLGYTKTPYKYDRQHKSLGREMASIIKYVHGKVFIPQPSIDLYQTTGSASDFFCGDIVAKEFNYRPYSLTIELRPASGGLDGFVLPPEQIVPSGEEIYPAVLHFINRALKKDLGP